MCVCGSDWHGCKGGERPDYSPWWPGQVHEVCGEKKLLRHRDLKKMLACPPLWQCVDTIRKSNTYSTSHQPALVSNCRKGQSVTIYLY